MSSSDKIEIKIRLTQIKIKLGHTSWFGNRKTERDSFYLSVARGLVESCSLVENVRVRFPEAQRRTYML